MGEPNIFSKGLYTIIFLLALDDFTKRTTSTSSSLLYPYGSLSYDTIAPPSDDGVNGPITLSTKLTLFGNASTIIYVDNNGLLSFNTSISAFTPNKLPVLGGSNPFVAPFWADVDNAIAGDIYYRQSTDTDLLSRATSDIRSYFSLPTFSATWVFVATWSNVAYYGSTAVSSTVNTFQAVLITNASLTFAMFNYASIHWTTGTSSGGDSKGTGGTPALAGVNSGYKVGYYQIPSSLTTEIINISSTSNVNFPGRWVFKLDKLYPEDPSGIIVCHRFRHTLTVSLHLSSICVKPSQMSSSLVNVKMKPFHNNSETGKKMLSSYTRHNRFENICIFFNIFFFCFQKDTLQIQIHKHFNIKKNVS
ncbi:sushi, nidogen and EGF-like domain-containing protein 1 isoform X1 [Aquarana catesbeiana]|uniref:sushi, nidogen and EGF-like domain-containing protein 1 isoform X1 n=2 Tax=Aquarana catesbeiana TaxID=8400 RepID=UPI003CC99783